MISPNRSNLLTAGVRNLFMRDRSHVIPQFHGNSSDGLEGIIPPELQHIFHCRVKPSGADAQIERERYEEARADYTSAFSEMGQLIGEIADWDEQTALMLAGRKMWFKLIVLSYLSSLGGLKLTFRRKKPPEFRESPDLSLLLIFFTGVPLWLSTCRLVGLKLNQGITTENIAPLLVIGGFAFAINLALKEGVALWLRVTRKGEIQEDGSVHIEVVQSLKEPVVLFSIGVVILEMMVGAPGIIGALPIAIAKNPLWQASALLLGGMGALGNQMLAWASGIKAKRKELLWLTFKSQQDPLWTERAQKVSRAFELQKLLPLYKKEIRWRKRRSRAAHRQALRVYRYWWRLVFEALNQKQQVMLPPSTANGHKHQQDQEQLR
jgi:hypothetical protein